MTFIGRNPADGAHDLADHPENRQRTHAILDALAAAPATSRFPALEPDRAATRDEVLAVHSPRVWLNLENHDGDSAFLDPDTYVVPGSVPAALTTARLSIQSVLRSRAEDEAGFVVARPPGHHATADRSMGFCLLNNVALAAQHAILSGANRILVFDHDVHHGNGTQDIFFQRADVLYMSFHLSPHYPGTGAIGEIGEGEGEGFTVNAPLSPGDGDLQVRSLLEHVFLPIAREYRPDLVLFSSGFDSLAGDPLGGLALSAPFFGELAGRFRQLTPRLVAFLEGGYQIDKLGPAGVHLARGLDGRPPDHDSRVHAPACEAALRRQLQDWWPSLR